MACYEEHLERLVENSNIEQQINVEQVSNKLKYTQVMLLKATVPDNIFDSLGSHVVSFEDNNMNLLLSEDSINLFKQMNINCSHNTILDLEQEAEIINNMMRHI
jgi:hypothetical protein